MRVAPTILAGSLACLFLAGCQTTSPKDIEWKDQLHNNLAVLGARNWIVIAESSFPSYAGNGVKTVVVDHPSDVVFGQVLDSLEMEGHVQPRIMVSSELSKISEDYAPGIKKYRGKIAKLLPGRMHFELPNRIINGQVEDATKMFNVLVIKTSTSIPYSNIYIELDSGYWSSESETALRSKLESPAQSAQKLVQPIQGTHPEPVPAVQPQQPAAAEAPASPSLDKLPELPKQVQPQPVQQAPASPALPPSPSAKKA